MADQHRAVPGRAFAAYPPKLAETCLLAGCPPEGVVLDPFLGSGTTAAVTAFQQANGLTADGIAGKATQNAIYAAINGGSSSSGGSSSGSSTSPASYGAKASSNGYTTISSTSGSNSSNVKAVQSALSAKGYYNGDYDGSYGSGTEQAVKDFQKAMGLRVTGMAGPTTQRLLYGGTSASGSYSKLQQGDTGSKVKQLQYALYELKYYDGDITGTYDTATTNAVLTFQQVHGLEMWHCGPADSADFVLLQRHSLQYLMNTWKTPVRI